MLGNLPLALTIVSLGVFLFWLAVGMTLGELDWKWPTKLALAGGMALSWPVTMGFVVLCTAGLFALAVLYTPVALVGAIRGKTLVKITKGNSGTTAEGRRA